MKIIITFISIYFTLFFKTTEKEQISSFPTPSVFLGPDSTITNKYAAVTEICDNGNIIVDNASEFKAGDKILIYQTQGAVIDTSNTANFGKIQNYANAGNYEMGFIASIVGNFALAVAMLAETWFVVKTLGAKEQLGIVARGGHAAVGRSATLP